MTSQNPEGEQLHEEEFEVMLIEEVKRRSCLYNKADENYCNNIMRHDEWNTIAALINSAKNVSYLNGDLCCKRWSELKNRFQKAIKSYKEIPSGDEFPIDLDWLVITEMQFMNDHVSNRPVLSTMDIPAASSISSPFDELPSSSNIFMERLRDEQNKFSGPLSTNKKRSIWSAPQQEKERIRHFQDVLPEKVPELDEFAKAKLTKRNGIIASVQEYGKKLEDFSKVILDQENQRGMYHEILEGVIRQMDSDGKKEFYQEAKLYLARLQK